MSLAQMLKHLLHVFGPRFVYRTFQFLDIGPGNDVQRIDAVSFGFGHRLAAGIANNWMEIHLVERNRSSKMHAGHDHARDPKVDDILGSGKH